MTVTVAAPTKGTVVPRNQARIDAERGDRLLQADLSVLIARAHLYYVRIGDSPEICATLTVSRQRPRV